MPFSEHDLLEMTARNLNVRISQENQRTDMTRLIAEVRRLRTVEVSLNQRVHVLDQQYQTLTRAHRDLQVRYEALRAQLPPGDAA